MFFVSWMLVSSKGWMDVCLKACANGIQHCRPLISLDGCFLKRKYEGQLLVAVGIDANDCIYPIAYAIIEIENIETKGKIFASVILICSLYLKNNYSII